MSYFSAVISGLIQGLTEFLPVSSSGHLSIFHGITGEADFTFDVLLHLATLAAVFIVYRRDISSLVRAFFTLSQRILLRKVKTEKLTADERVLVSVMLATLPMALAVFISDRAEAMFSDVRTVGAMLILNAAVLLMSDRVRRRYTRTADRLTSARSLCIGCFQLCAVVPGLSRSGMTVTGGLCMGLDRESAVRMSFIMSIPVIICANLSEVLDIVASPVHLTAAEALPYLVGVLCAFVSGLLSMKLLTFIAREKNSFRIFSLYCAVVGLLAVIFG